MDVEQLVKEWKAEEAQAHIHGWDFSHIDGRCEEGDLPWNYRDIVQAHLRAEHRLLDIDTGGGEFLLSLGHPAERTAATEGYPPNVALCRKTLSPLGIDFREMDEPAPMPFDDGKFDRVINRHGAFDVPELWRVLKPGGLFITQQVGDDNDWELTKLLMPERAKPAPGLNLADQSAAFERQGFTILQSGECFRPIRFYDVGALVWFARIIVWEFPEFSVDACLDRLLLAQQILERDGAIEGRTHRYMIVAQKNR